LCSNCLLKRIVEGKVKRLEDEEEDVSSYWMMFEETGRYWKLKSEALDLTVALEESMDLW
jgi:hypothetical protein